MRNVSTGKGKAAVMCNYIYLTDLLYTHFDVTEKKIYIYISLMDFIDVERCLA